MSNSSKIINSDELHNQNCHLYLKAMKESLTVTDFVRDKLSPGDKLPSLGDKLRGIDENYDPSYAYGDLYSEFYAYLDDNIDAIYSSLLKNETQERQELDDFIYAIYNNDSKILEHTYSKIADTVSERTLNSPNHEKRIAAKIKNDHRVNRISMNPAQAGSWQGRIRTMFSPNFKPQGTTNLPNKRSYNYNQHTTRLEYRIGTQVQRHHIKGKESVIRVSPIFVRWLAIHAEKVLSAEERENGAIAHVYINNLGLDRTDWEGKKERALSLALHKLEHTENNHIAVITLPADKGLMHEKEFSKTKDAHPREAVFNQFLNIVTGVTQDEIKDFRISPKIRARLFPETDEFSTVVQKAKFTQLLNESFQALNLDTKDTISSAERQAVWFHFNKFVFTDYIFETLKPKSSNTSCKDAIDRGAAASAYYNLLKSFNSSDSSTPLSRSEFEQALHSASAMVKGRGMNHHLNRIWNAIDAYVNAHYDEIDSDPAKAWLINWRDLNCPHERAEQLLELRIPQVKEKLKKMQQADNRLYPAAAMSAAQKVLLAVENQYNAGVSGKRLLLETVSLTPEILLNPTLKNKARYEKLATSLTIFSPTLTILAGYMKALMGALFFIPSLGHSKHWIPAGLKTAKAGHEIEERNKIIKNINHLIKNQPTIGILPSSSDTNYPTILMEPCEDSESEEVATHTI